MSNNAYLILENGMVFEGISFGARSDIIGEIVFTTGMTGYLETITDLSYYGQIILQTFPLIGNVGVIPSDFESSCIGASAYICKYLCQEPSNFRSEGNLDTFFKQKNIVGLCGIDTRQLTKIIRENGVMNGKITSSKPNENDIETIKQYTVKNAVMSVSCKEKKLYKSQNSKYTIALLDFGLKDNIRRELINRDCDVWVFPSNTTLDEIKKTAKIDGIMLSNGPGNPSENKEIIKNLKEIMHSKITIFGICLGHQLMALANGFKTQKLKYGHRGSNQPVKDLETGRVYITSQNHGYAVVSESIDINIADEWFINVNDKTCEGLKYKNAPIFTVQFHPEACGGPKDTAFLFDMFIDVIKNK